jgi:hypothetical protein
MLYWRDCEDTAVGAGKHLTGVNPVSSATTDDTKPIYRSAYVLAGPPNPPDAEYWFLGMMLRRAGHIDRDIHRGGEGELEVLLRFKSILRGLAPYMPDSSLTIQKGDVWRQ